MADSENLHVSKKLEASRQGDGDTSVSQILFSDTDLLMPLHEDSYFLFNRLYKNYMDF